MTVATDHRKTLEFLLAANHLRRDGQVKITVPFSADIEPGNMPVRITEVRERSASWVSLLDERKSGVINLANVLVDPAEIEWRPTRQAVVAEIAKIDPPLAEALTEPRKREEEPVTDTKRKSIPTETMPRILPEAQKAERHLRAELSPLTQSVISALAELEQLREFKRRVLELANA